MFAQPIAELVPASLNTHTGEVVKRALRKFHKSALKLTDSQIVINWISNKELKLKQWVRSRVVDILRFTKASSWRYVQSSDMIADIGTRHGAKIDDALPGSVWMEGFPWMHGEISSFPVKTCEETKLSKSEMLNLKEESVVTKGSNDSFADDASLQGTETYISTGYSIGQKVHVDVQTRYQFSDYLYDPNKYGYNRAIRVVAIVMRFISLCKNLKNIEDSIRINEIKKKDKSCKRAMFQNEHDTMKGNVMLSDKELQKASDYFYKKPPWKFKNLIKKIPI